MRTVPNDDGLTEVVKLSMTTTEGRRGSIVELPSWKAAEYYAANVAEPVPCQDVVDDSVDEDEDDGRDSTQPELQTGDGPTGELPGVAAGSGGDGAGGDLGERPG